MSTSTNFIIKKASPHAPVIRVYKVGTGDPGTWRMALPYRNRAFLADFRRLCGSQYREWLPKEEAWELRPLEMHHLEYILNIARPHFPEYQFVLDQNAGPDYMPTDFNYQIGGEATW